MALTIIAICAVILVAFIAYEIGGIRGYRDGYEDCKRINDPRNYTLTRMDTRRTPETKP